MLKKNICPCPNLKCPNHDNCKDCTSRHLKMGSLNYCAFYSILPELEESVKSDPDSPAAVVIKNRIERQTSAYNKLKEKYSISEEELEKLRNEKSEVSEY